MKKIYRILSFLFLFIFTVGESVNGQTPAYYKAGTGTLGNTIPMNQASQKTQLLYAPSDFNTLPISGYISKIYFRNSAAGSSGDFNDFQVSFLQNNSPSFPSTSFFTGLTPVLSASVFSITGNAVAPGWFEIPLPATFLYDNTLTLIVEIQYTGKVNGLSSTTSTSVGNKRCSGMSLTATTGTTNTTWNDFGMDIVPGGPCTSPPVAGSATALPSTVCATAQVQLNLTSSSGGSGQVYQWESASNIGGPYFPVGTLQTSAGLTINPTSTEYYHCVVTCGASAVASSPVLITVNPGFAGGSYTINDALPTGGGNFASFTDAIAALSCGISGSVSFNVAPGSGPYNEQVSIPQILGTSAANTVIFNGNGATLTYAASVSTAPHTLALNGADYVSFDNLNIIGTGAAYALSCHLYNQADNNSFSNCTFSAPTAGTVTTLVPFSISGSATSATTSGISGHNNLVSNCTITGGYYGVVLYGNATAGLQAQGNIVSNNIIQDAYAYIVYMLYQNGAIISGNNLSRPTRTTTATTIGGVYCSTGCVNTFIEKNKVHNMFDALLTNTATCYSIGLLADGTAAQPNYVVNNLVYSMNGNGPQYGIYNSTAPYMYAYHNTIILDDQASTAGTTYGLYQTGATSGVEFRNNLVYITRSGTGAKRCIYFVSTTTGNTSNNNAFYLNSPAGVNNVGQYVGTNYPTLQDWQTANSGAYDQQSVGGYDPLFLSPATGDYTPQNVLLDNIGFNAGITTDILGNPRSATPDPGAYEFNLAPCTSPPNAGNAVASAVIPVCPGISVSLNLTGNSIGVGQTYEWLSSASAGGTYTSISAVSSTIPISIAPVTTLWYKAAVTCSGNTQYSAPVQVQVIPPAFSGTYTIDATQPTGGSNFHSFGEAITAMNCGISGPVIFNVASGSGPYIEQVIIPVIGNSSATNTVTINGNGQTIEFNSMNSNERAVIKLNGTDYLTINNLVINSLTGTYGFGIQLLNNADHNTINNCTFNINQTNTLTTNFACIVINSTATAITTVGNSGCDFNTISNNTINGGYTGIAIVGNGATNIVNGNSITGNTVKDFYEYGMYINGNEGLLIRGNDVSRPNRTSVTTFRGIGLNGISLSTTIDANRLHNPFGGAPASTAAAFNIYMINCDATPGSYNVVSNNLIYDHIGSTGNHNGVLNVSSDYVKFLHNTILLNDVGATCTACAARGFYLQTAPAVGLEYKNNIVSITQGGTAPKQCIYFEGTGATNPAFVSDHNDFYMGSTGGATNQYGFYNGAGLNTIANWQLATGQDLNSPTPADPLFQNVAAGDLTPTNPVLNNLGTPVGIFQDYYGLARSATLPDLGAIEFLSSPLAVKLLRFSALRNNEDVRLSWLATSELNTGNYVVERSIDGKIFTPVGTIKAIGNLTATSVYEMTDPEAFTKAGSNILYYRLQIVEQNGKYSYSQTEKLEKENKDATILKVYPNPFKDKVIITIRSEKNTEAVLKIKDVNGRVVLSETRNLEKGNNKVEIGELDKLATGVYQMIVEVSGKLFTEMLVK